MVGDRAGTARMGLRQWVQDGAETVSTGWGRAGMLMDIPLCRKLLSVLTQYVEQAGRGEPCESLPQTFKALEYIFKFIVRSRHLFAQ